AVYGRVVKASPLEGENRDDDDDEDRGNGKRRRAARPAAVAGHQVPQGSPSVQVRVGPVKPRSGELVRSLPQSDLRRPTRWPNLPRSMVRPDDSLRSIISAVAVKRAFTR